MEDPNETKNEKTFRYRSSRLTTIMGIFDIFNSEKKSENKKPTKYQKNDVVYLIKDKKIAIFGFGDQAKAHALNLKDSGINNIVIALRENSKSISKAEAKGFTDSMMLDYEGNVAEATGANVFFKNETGELHTPVPDSFLDGITRREVIKIAKSKGIKVIERKIKPDEMKNFVGCFLTGTAAEITPVSQINDYKFEVCNVISDLNDAYQNLVRKKDSAA